MLSNTPVRVRLTQLTFSHTLTFKCSFSTPEPKKLFGPFGNQTHRFFLFYFKRNESLYLKRQRVAKVRHWCDVGPLREQRPSEQRVVSVCLGSPLVTVSQSPLCSAWPLVSTLCPPFSAGPVLNDQESSRQLRKLARKRSDSDQYYQISATNCASNSCNIRVPD